MGSPQTLSEADRRIVAAWAADCAERVLGLFEAEAPGDGRPREAIVRARAFARGELGIAEEIRRRSGNGGAAREVSAPAAVAAARAAGQAAAIPHMGAHALGAAAYAAKAVGLAAPNQQDATDEEIRWQLDHMSGATKDALRRLPPVGEDSSGPLGPGLLARGVLGTAIRTLQSGLSEAARTPAHERTRATVARQPATGSWRCAAVALPPPTEPAGHFSRPRHSMWNVRMPVTFNHSILAARDRHESARFLAEILDLAEPTNWGPFAQVQLDGGVSIQFAEPPVEEIQMQHYAFLVDDERFDAILARVQARGIPYTADPNQSRPQQINTNHDGRGFYFHDPAGHGFEVLTRPYGSADAD